MKTDFLKCFGILACCSLLVFACADSQEDKTKIAREGVGRMKLKSSAFSHRGSIPSKYTCDGADVSPPLQIDDVPDTAQALALVVDDPDAPGGTFDHWLLWNFPPETDELPERIEQTEKVDKLAGALQGRNDFGQPGYRGPCPPGGEHRYRFELYALSEPLELSAGSKKSALQGAMEEKILGRTELVGKYSR